MDTAKLRQQIYSVFCRIWQRKDLKTVFDLQSCLLQELANEDEDLCLLAVQAFFDCSSELEALKVKCRDIFDAQVAFICKKFTSRTRNYNIMLTIRPYQLGFVLKVFSSHLSSRYQKCFERLVDDFILYLNDTKDKYIDTSKVSLVIRHLKEEVLEFYLTSWMKRNFDKSVSKFALKHQSIKLLSQMERE